jgi:hypothetical protein
MSVEDLQYTLEGTRSSVVDIQVLVHGVYRPLARAKIIMRAGAALLSGWSGN